MIEGAPSDDPYVQTHQPASSGRVFLARAFAHYCALHWGLSPEEVSSALAGTGAPLDVRQVSIASSLIGGLFADGLVETFARPIGGGEPTRLSRTVWELDVHAPRFLRSALCVGRPFDQSAAPTHWIFVDGRQFDDVLEASCADVVPRTFPKTDRDAAVEPGAEPVAPTTRFVRLPEVERRTGLKRSTIYARMKEGRFPQNVPLGGNVAAWRESDIEEWLAEPR